MHASMWSRRQWIYSAGETPTKSGYLSGVGLMKRAADECGNNANELIAAFTSGLLKTDRRTAQAGSVNRLIDRKTRRYIPARTNSH